MNKIGFLTVSDDQIKATASSAPATLRTYPNNV